MDELGAHLHPRWRMEITTRLRRELPQVQFFVSTHEPLCLRGMFDREVIRVTKAVPERPADAPPPPGRVRLEVVDRSPSHYRVDQLLTSEFFGLGTTLDPDLERRFQAYYRLLALDPEELEERGLDGELEELKTHLDLHARPALGFTRRDQLVYEAIDRFLARPAAEAGDEAGGADGGAGDWQAPRTREEVLERIQGLWRSRRALFPGTGPGRGPGRGRGGRR